MQQKNKKKQYENIVMKKKNIFSRRFLNGKEYEMH